MKKINKRTINRLCIVAALAYALILSGLPSAQVSAQGATAEPSEGFAPIVDAGTDVINAVNTDAMVIAALVIAGIVVIATVIVPQFIQTQSINKLVDTVTRLAESPITRAAAAPTAATVDELNDAFLARVLADGKPGNDALAEWLHGLVDKQVTERLEKLAGVVAQSNVVADVDKSIFGNVPGDVIKPGTEVPQEGADPTQGAK